MGRLQIDKWTFRRGQEESSLLPRLGQGPFVLAHWNANFCSFVPEKPLCFLSLEAWFSLSCPWWSSPAATISLEPQEIFIPWLLFCPDLFFIWSVLQFDFHSFLHSSSGVKSPDYGFLVKIRNLKWIVTRILGFLPLTSILEETEIEILAGESLQGLWFSFKRN